MGIDKFDIRNTVQVRFILTSFWKTLCDTLCGVCPAITVSGKPYCQKSLNTANFKSDVLSCFPGPAYSLQKIGDNVYVTAGGTKHELIAIYEFEVMFAADYVVWKQTFAKTNTTNDISFRIDDGDWLNWQLPYKVSHALWTQYYFQVCLGTDDGKHVVRPKVVRLFQQAFGSLQRVMSRYSQ